MTGNELIEYLNDLVEVTGIADILDRDVIALDHVDELGGVTEVGFKGGYITLEIDT